MSESFGARLRQQREQQQVALSAIADKTKIKLSLLEGLERDDVSRWPSGIFRRSFVRAYAQTLGLDPDAIVREFLELYPEPEIVFGAPGAAPDSDGGSPAAGAPARFRELVGSALGSFSRAPFLMIRGRKASSEEVPAANTVTEALPQAASDTNEDAQPHPDLAGVARLCTDLAQLGDPALAAPLLAQAVAVLDAVGAIVWVSNPAAADLRPVLAHGYPEAVLTRLPRVPCRADNATAAAYRTGHLCIVNGTDEASGALVLPLLSPAGCIGVLAIELRGRAEQRDSIRALATIIAAQVARLFVPARLAEAAPPGRRTRMAR